MEDTTELFGIEKVHVLYIDCDVLSQDEDVWEVSDHTSNTDDEEDQIYDIGEYYREEDIQFEDVKKPEEETEEETSESEEEEAKPYIISFPELL